MCTYQLILMKQVVSGLGREIPSPNGNAIRGAIQTDAAINAGKNYIFTWSPATHSLLRYASVLHLFFCICGKYLFVCLLDLGHLYFYHISSFLLELLHPVVAKDTLNQFREGISSFNCKKCLLFFYFIYIGPLPCFLLSVSFLVVLQAFSF